MREMFWKRMFQTEEEQGSKDGSMLSMFMELHVGQFDEDYLKDGKNQKQLGQRVGGCGT
jgi:hypothetical protein